MGGQGNGVITVDPSKLPAHFASKEAEAKFDAKWDESGIYRYDPAADRRVTYVVDTPPPTVSGSLHVGHVFSYTHTDLIVRYRRMRGFNIFYPMGWDDNGLPTERRVQNYFNVRCDPRTPYEPNLDIAPVSGKESKEPPRIVSRQNFIELCLRLTHEDERAFKALWRRVGLSVDWAQEYSTINDLSRKTAQLSFLDLYNKGHVYNDDAPTMWDVDFQTAVAQAEVEDHTLSGFFYHLRFGVAGSDESFVIATTRPELLPACVGVAAHPDDSRYRHLLGRRAVTPLFSAPVPIFGSDIVDPDKGTGILMVCTFGDATDVVWWRQQKLPLRQVLGRDGRLAPVGFGTRGWDSLDPEAANRYYTQLAGKTVKQAQKVIAELLARPESGYAASPALVQPPKPIEHSVKFFEKGDRPLELIPARQWFVRLLDKKEELLAQGEKIAWHPDFMRTRYRNWTENLQLDWCISRQRYFGVAFPMWYPLNGQAPDFSRPILADPSMLPVDPMQSAPPGFRESQRGKPGGFIGESDVFDTWFTSSLSPQIGSRWAVDPERHRKLYPADVRPQAHEIIRTWAFYTIAKSLLHEGKIPWSDVLISGWVLNRDHKKESKTDTSKKMSKSKGKTVTPDDLLDEYGADAVRYWSANARLGSDTAFDENVIKIGRRLVTKIFNASKFVLSQSAVAGSATRPLDLAFLRKLASLADLATESFDRFEYAVALGDTEKFFWNDFTDSFLELVKMRARSENDQQGQTSAVAALRAGLNVLLRLFAPFLPYITEEVWSWAFAAETGLPSIHRAPWPTGSEIHAIAPAGEPELLRLATECWSQINKRKTDEGVSIGRPAGRITVAANKSTIDDVRAARTDIAAAARAENLAFIEDATVAQGTFEIREAVFSPKPEA